MKEEKLLLSFLLIGGTLCGVILALIFSPYREDKRFNSILNHCREKLEKLEELLKEV